MNLQAKLQKAATVFNWDILIGDQSVGVPFGNIRFSHTVSGFGTSGVASGQFEFDLYDKDGTYSTAILENAEVQLVELDSAVLPSRTYYIARRSINKKICHFVAYDVLSQTDKSFDPSDLPVYDGSSTYPCSDVLNAIGVQCGISFEDITGGEYINFTLSQLETRTCRNILEMISTALCGVWVNGYGNWAVLSPFGAQKDASFGMSSVKKYGEIDYRGRQRITKIIFVNSDTGVENVLTNDAYGVVLEIESPFAAAGTGLDELVWDRINVYEYQAWNCDKAILEHAFVSASGFMIFDSSQLLANKVSLSVDSTGIYFSGGLEPQDEWNYEEYLDRKKIGTDESIGNTMIDSSGRIVFVNKNKGGYNLDERDNGISYFRSEN